MQHLRVPAIDHGAVSAVWGIVLGAYIYFGLLAVGIHGGTAFVFAALSAFFIFLFVRLYGDDLPPD